MGVERLFSSIRENIIIKNDTIRTRTIEMKLDIDIMCIDFNSIIHTSSVHVNNNLNKILYRLANNLSIDNKIQSYIDAYDIKTITTNYETFKKYMTSDKIDDIIVSTIEKQIYMIVSEFIEADKLQILQIAIDGVPSKAKMMEQKKRRYMGYMMTGIVEKIYEKHKSKLKNEDPSRVFFIENKLHWSKNNISPGTEFMYKMSEFLHSDNFYQKLKKICPNLTKYIIDDSFNYGEGEKKIMELLLLMKEKNLLKHKICVYSPDSDMTILCLILQSNNIENIHIIRHNQQQENYDLIDIDLLGHNLYDFVNKKSGKKQNKNNILCDISYLFTIFGNDFIPKIESINVKQDFEDLVNTYVEILKDNKYLIDISKPIKKLNMNVLFHFIKLLHVNEGSNLQKNYIATHYRNYNKLKDILKANNNNFTQKLNKFLEQIREFNDMIKHSLLSPLQKVDDVKDNKNIEQDKEFIEILKQFVRINGTNFIKEYKDYYRQNKSFPKVRIGFQSYSHTVNDEFHKKKIEQLHLLDEHMKLTDYDTELYQFENALDEYQQKLNFESLNLGAIRLDYKNYVLRSDKIINDVKKYYKDFFGIDDISVTNPQMYKLINSYLEGLIWIFEYYMNGQVGDKYVMNYWYYRYSRAPLLKQIYDFMKMHDLDEQNKKIRSELDNFVDKKYFNCLEHLIYVSPEPTIKNLLKIDIKTNINIDDIIKKIWNNSNNNLIDCRGAIFITKCHLKLDFETTMKQDEEFIDNIRKMKFTDKIKKITKI